MRVGGQKQRRVERACECVYVRARVREGASEMRACVAMASESEFAHA
jgi:hypothetical protein